MQTENISEEVGWNVLASAKEGKFQDALHVLHKFGHAWSTNFYNVIALKVVDIDTFLNEFKQFNRRHSYADQVFSRIAPAKKIFHFSNIEEFENEVEAYMRTRTGDLNLNTFCLRIHRHGSEQEIPSRQSEERFLAKKLLEKLWEKDMNADVDFDAPDFVLDIETLNGQAGISLWSKNELKDAPFINVIK